MSEPAKSANRRSNRWWKIGFIVALLAFEFTRELYVERINEPPHFAVAGPEFYRAQDGSWISAEGRWQPTDSGPNGEPSVVKIVCERAIGSCVVAETTVENDYVSSPDVNRWTAAFTDTGAEFTNDSPICSSLFVRIDAIHNVATGTWTPKESTDAACKGYKRVEMRLGGNPPNEQSDAIQGHFMPLFSLLRAMTALF